MEIRDFNGTGDWSAQAVQARYLRLARSIGLTQLLDLAPNEYSEANVRWVYPVMDKVIEGIKAGDPACIELGIEFIEGSSQHPIFNHVLRSNTARRLRQRATALDAAQIDRLQRRILGILVKGWIPHEFHEYVRLLRRIGLGSRWREVVYQLDRENPYVMRFVNYLEKYAGAERPEDA